MLRLILLTLLSLSSTCYASEGTTVVYYGDHAPNFWNNISPKCCGANQSPIDIDPQTVQQADFGSLEMPGYDLEFKSGKLNLDHSANTIEVSIPDTAGILIKGGGLADQYVLAQFHFHWGMNDYRGSEHTVNGKAFPAEIHFVHYNSKYTSLSDAMSHEDGVAVLGIFVDVDYSLTTPQPGFEAIRSAIRAASLPGTHSIILSALKMSDFLPGDLNSFTRYSGSLTTPNCDEVVTWTVFKDPIYVTGAQIQYLRKYLQWVGPNGLLSAHVDNYRPVQPLNCRVVEKSFSGDYILPKSAKMCNQQAC